MKLTPDNYRHYGSPRIVINGEDVTSRCREADDKKGYVIIFKVNANGKIQIDYSKVQAVQEWRYGHVEFIKPS